MDAIIKKPAYELVNLIRKKEISSLEVTTAFLERIHEKNPDLNAVIQMDEELTLDQAKKADNEIMSGKSLGALHGLPITIKDTIDIFGYKNTYGSYLYENYQPKTEGTCITRLRKAGAVILGLTNSPELLSAFETDNLLYGRTNNPHDLNLTAGGSSGGEAAIIAVHGSPLGLGSDGAGSIRVPAHFCGITGIKPTQGLIPLTGVALPFTGAGCLQGFGTFGPMARYVDDLILSLSVLAGPDNLDPDCPPVTPGNPNTVDIKKLKVAFFVDNGIVKPDREITNVVLNAVEALTQMGVQIEEARPQGIEKSMELLWEPFFTFCDGGESACNMLGSLSSERISPLRQQFNRDARQYNLTATELNRRFLEISEFKWNTYQFLNDYDCIICPPCATTAKSHGQTLENIRDFSYTMAFNASGSPAAVIPFGFSEAGLPIGIQIVANVWKDHTLLALARKLEEHHKYLQSLNNVKF